MLVFFQKCNGSEFTVLGDIVKCGLTDTETCMRAVTLALSSRSTVRQLPKYVSEKIIQGPVNSFPNKTASLR
jgi:hypothetical protein